MTQKRKQTPSLTGFTGKKNNGAPPLTNPTVTLFLAAMFVAILFALLSAKRNWDIAEGNMEQDSEGQIVRSPKIVDAPEVRKLPQPPPPIVRSEVVEDAFDVPEEILLEETAPEDLKIKTQTMDLEVTVPDDLFTIDPAQEERPSN